MDDLQYGTRNKRGDWAPNEPAGTAPLFAYPPRPLAVLKWLPSYFLPYNVLFALSAVAWWRFVLPDVEVMKTLSVGWILWLFVVNCAALLVFFGVFELRLYIFRAQGNRFKYNGKWPSEQKSKAFFFENQNLDNMLRTFGTGMPIWTAIEVAILYAYANGYVPWLSFAEHPLSLFLLALVVPIIHETHFFLLHRTIHWGPLYKWVHSVHHNSVNPSPWSSLSMHPVEQLGISASPSGTSSSRPTRCSRSTSSTMPASAPFPAMSASTRSSSPRTSRSIATPTSTTCTTNISR